MENNKDKELTEQEIKTQKRREYKKRYIEKKGEEAFKKMSSEYALKYYHTYKNEKEYMKNKKRKEDPNKVVHKRVSKLADVHFPEYRGCPKHVLIERITKLEEAIKTLQKQ